MFYIYILRSKTTQRYYVGSTEDVHKRLDQHNAGRSTSTSTRSGMPWELIHTEHFVSRSEAMLQERRIKARGVARYLSDIENSSID